MIHFHGTPISPRKKMLAELPGRCFCVSFSEPRDVDVCHEIGQSVMLDNGAFSFWTQKKPVEWQAFYSWAEPWLDFETTWAVIPDVIEGGDEEANDRLLAEWRNTGLQRGAPVWHMHESLYRLKRLCHGYPRVCIGSSAQYRNPQSDAWRFRMEDAMNAICEGTPGTWLHMLRAMNQAAGGPYPFASADSTNLARNHAGSHRRRVRSLRSLADEIDSRQSPARWCPRTRTLELSA